MKTNTFYLYIVGSAVYGVEVNKTTAEFTKVFGGPDYTDYVCMELSGSFLDGCIYLFKFNINKRKVDKL